MLMEDKVKRISLWSSTRNISTDLMYSFAQRKDTKVFDEPLYAHYLSNSPAKEYHPAAEEVLRNMENEGEKVVEMMLSNNEKPVLFFKNMTHHLIELDRSFLSKTTNIILTREPKAMITSFSKVIERPLMRDIGYQMQFELVQEIIKKDLPVIVIDSKDILLHPELALKKLCQAIDIPFDKAMLKWKAGSRAEDGCWAPYWYANVHQSKGFMPYQEKEDELKEELIPLYREAKNYYERICEYKL
jgi:hypothetical protein